MDGVDNIVPQLKAARQSVMVSFYLHSLLTSSVSPVPFVHAKLDKDILHLWLSGMLHFPGLAFTGVSFLNATATGCIYILDMLRCFVPILGPMFLAWDECMKCLYLVLEGEAPTPFLPRYPYRQWETRKVSFGSKDAKEDSKRRIDSFPVVDTHQRNELWNTFRPSAFHLCPHAKIMSDSYRLMTNTEVTE